eukprot:1360279-Prymnesium_polylepis.3
MSAPAGGGCAPACSVAVIATKAMVETIPHAAAMAAVGTPRRASPPAVSDMRAALNALPSTRTGGSQWCSRRSLPLTKSWTVNATTPTRVVPTTNKRPAC